MYRFNLLYYNNMGIAGVRSPDNMKFFDKKPLCVVYYDVERGGRD